MSSYSYKNLCICHLSFELRLEMKWQWKLFFCCYDSPFTPQFLFIVLRHLLLLLHPHPLQFYCHCSKMCSLVSSWGTFEHLELLGISQNSNLSAEICLKWKSWGKSKMGLFECPPNFHNGYILKEICDECESKDS